VKIYVAAVEALRKTERQGETQKTINFFLMYFFAGFLKFHPIYDQTQGTDAVFS
jgi:hypothetical protein